MNVLIVLAVLVGLGFVLILLWVVGTLLWEKLPIVAGVVAAIVLWWKGHDNIAVIAAIAGFVVYHWIWWPLGVKNGWWDDYRIHNQFD